MVGSKPYAKLKSREVNGARMAYVDEGEGDAIAFQQRATATEILRHCQLEPLEYGGDDTAMPIGPGEWSETAIEDRAT